MTGAGFEVGDRVTWTSQSAGVTKAKAGAVSFVVQPGVRPALKNAGSARDHESYLVRSDSGRLYWPRVAHLRLERSP